MIYSAFHEGQQLTNSDCRELKLSSGRSSALGAPFGRNLVVKTHAQRRPGSQSSQPAQREAGSGAMGAVEVDAKRQRAKGGDDDDDDSDGGITFEIHDNEAKYATKLITQFAGKETDTSSCLAFAPKTRRGTNNKAMVNRREKTAARLPRKDKRT